MPPPRPRVYTHGWRRIPRVLARHAHLHAPGCTRWRASVPSRCGSPATGPLCLPGGLEGTPCIPASGRPSTPRLPTRSVGRTVCPRHVARNGRRLSKNARQLQFSNRTLILINAQDRLHMLVPWPTLKTELLMP